MIDLKLFAGHLITPDSVIFCGVFQSKQECLLVMEEQEKECIRENPRLTNSDFFYDWNIIDACVKCEITFEIKKEK